MRSASARLLLAKDPIAEEQALEQLSKLLDDKLSLVDNDKSVIPVILSLTELLVRSLDRRAATAGPLLRILNLLKTALGTRCTRLLPVSLLQQIFTALQQSLHFHVKDDALCKTAIECLLALAADQSGLKAMGFDRLLVGEGQRSLALAHLYSILIDIAVSDRHSIGCVAKSLQLLDQLCAIVCSPDCLINFLPGLCSAIVRLSSKHRNHKRVMSPAFRLLSSLLAIVMNDNLLKTAPTAKIEAPPGLSTILRDQCWLDQTCGQLKTVFQLTLNPSHYSHVETLKALIEAVEVILINCRQSLAATGLLLLDYVMQLTPGSSLLDPAIAHLATEAAKELVDKLKNGGGDSAAYLNQWLKPRIFKLLAEELPAAVQSAAEMRRSRIFCLAVGYLRIIGLDSPVAYIPLQQCIDEVLDCLVILFSGTAGMELEAKHLENDKSAGQLSKYSSSTDPDALLQSLHSTDRHSPPATDAIEHDRHLQTGGEDNGLLNGLLFAICDVIGVQEILQLLMGRLIAGKSATDKSRMAAPVLRIINRILQRSSDDAFFDGLNSLSEWLLEFTTSLSLNNNSTTQTQHLAENLAFEGLGLVIATSRQSPAVSLSPSLIDRVIYPLMDAIVQPDPAIAKSALFTMQQIANWSEESTVASVINSHKQLVLSTVSYRLKYMDLQANVSTTRVLGLLLAVCGDSVMPLLKDCVEDVLEWLWQWNGGHSSKRRHHSCRRQFVGVESTLAFIAVLGDILAICSYRATNSPQLQIGSLASSAAIVELKRLAQRIDGIPLELLQECSAEIQQEALHHYHIVCEVQSAAAANISTETAGEEAELVEEEQLDPLKNLVGLCLLICDTVRHYTSADDPRLRALSIRALKCAVPIISRQKPEFIQLLDSIWWSIINRLVLDEYTPIVLETIALIEASVNTLGDFMLRKISEISLPAMLKLLTECRSYNVAETQTALYRFSVKFKIQKAILKCLRNCVDSGCINSDRFDAVLENMMRYWKSSQNSMLADLSVGVVRSMFALNCDPVWSKLLRFMPLDHPIWTKMARKVQDSILADEGSMDLKRTEASDFAVKCVQSP